MLNTNNYWYFNIYQHDTVIPCPIAEFDQKNWHVITVTDNLNVIPDARVRNIISKGPKYRLLSNIDFPKCRREITASLNDLSYRW